MVYGVRVDGTGTRHHLDIGEDIVSISKFPAGWYDGEVGAMRPYRDDENVNMESARTSRDMDEERGLLV